MRAVLKVDQEAVVVVTRRKLFAGFTIITAQLVMMNSFAAVLPEDRSDVLFHSYDGGGVTISGPSVLIRKGDEKSFSVFANYYVDSVSSASIDVITSGASRYAEERTENTVGIDYLHNKTSMSLAYTSSVENDYDASSLHFEMSQDMFGDLTTISMGYSQGWDKVGNNTDPLFSEDANRKNYRLSISQVMSKNLLVGAGLEVVTDQGFLNNPYRFIRYCDTTACSSYSLAQEIYPNTRTSVALALRARYFLPYRAALHAEYRNYEDDWDIKSDTFELGYTHPFGNKWIADFKFRTYSQGKAEFFSDLFPYANSQTFMARDKELSSFNSYTLGAGISYEFLSDHAAALQKGTVNLRLDHITFNYDDFRDLRDTASNVGDESLYQFSSNVWQLFVSVWY